MKLSVIEMLYIWVVQCGSHYLHVAIEQFKCGRYALGTEFSILLSFK